MWQLVSSIRSWSSRHKRALQCAGVVAGAAAGYALYKKLAPIVSELSASYKLLQQMEQDLSAEREKQHSERLHYQFEQSREAARLALLHVSVELQEKFDELFAISVLKDRLRKSDEFSRAEARLDEFKVAVVSRTLSLLYCLSLSSIVLRLQLCIAARYAACVENNAQQHQTNAEFLGMIQFLSSQGAENLAKVVIASVTNLTSSIGMKTMIDRRTFETLMDDIYQQVNKEILSDCLRFLMPTLNIMESDRVLSQMYSELVQLLSSQSIGIVLTASLQVAFQSLQPVFETFSGEGNPQILFGRTLPKFAHVFERHLPKDITEAESSSVLDALSQLSELNDFSSIVFFPIGQRNSSKASGDFPPEIV